MKSLRQQAYEVGVELELCRRKRQRKYFILKRRLERLIETMVLQSTSIEQAEADWEWLWSNLQKRFPDIDIGYKKGETHSG